RRLQSEQDGTALGLKRLGSLVDDCVNECVGIALVDSALQMQYHLQLLHSHLEKFMRSGELCQRTDLRFVLLDRIDGDRGMRSKGFQIFDIRRVKCIPDLVHGLKAPYHGPLEVDESYREEVPRLPARHLVDCPVETGVRVRIRNEQGFPGTNSVSRKPLIH